MADLVLRTERLELRALGADELTALMAGDAELLVARTGARFSRPAVPPPLLGEDLPYFLQRIQANPDELGWWVWLILLREGGEAVGAAGMAGPPDAEGTVVLGYAVYPHLEGRGYATEALGALVRWVTTHPGVRLLRATIPPDHTASIRVAEKIGLTPAGQADDPKAGPVVIYELKVEGA